MDNLVFRHLRERDADGGLPEKSGENLEGGDVRRGCGRIDRVFNLGEFLGCGVDLDEISGFRGREGGRGLVRREDHEAGD